MKRSTIILVIIIAIGALIRLGVLLHSCSEPVDSYPTMDEMNYRELASNIIDYKTYATWSEGFYTQSTRAPIYPLSIATAYSLSHSRDYCVPKILNFIIDIINILLIFFIALYLFNVNIGLISSAIYAYFGHAPYFMSISSPHTLAVMLLLLAILALITLRKSYWLATFALSIFYTLLIHTRPVFLVALPFLFIAIWMELSSYRHKSKWILFNWKHKIIRSLVPIVIITLLSLPWGIRNYNKHHTIVPVCTIAGWHISSNENYNLKLSIKYLMEQIYNPARRGYSEGKYFDIAKNNMTKTFFSNPFKFTIFGFARLLYSWSPPGPIYRCFLPKSYIYPNKLFNNMILPLIDFEGIIYITIFSSILILFLIGSKIYKIFLTISYKTRGVIILLLGYSIVHIIGIPLIAYRFLIEPMGIILFIVLMLKYLHILNKKYKITFMRKIEKYLTHTKNATNNCFFVTKKVNFILIFLYAIMALILTLLSIPIVIPSNKQIISYPQLSKNNRILTYQQLREMQWNNLGNIDPKTTVQLQGVVKYIHKGFKYVEDDYYAKKDPNYVAARIFIEYHSKDNPLGIGDVRVNFNTKDPLPNNDDVILITGNATTGPFKEIIISAKTSTP